MATGIGFYFQYLSELTGYIKPIEFILQCLRMVFWIYLQGILSGLMSNGDMVAGTLFVSRGVYKLDMQRLENASFVMTVRQGESHLKSPNNDTARLRTIFSISHCLKIST